MNTSNQVCINTEYNHFPWEPVFMNNTQRISDEIRQKRILKSRSQIFSIFDTTVNHLASKSTWKQIPVNVAPLLKIGFIQIKPAENIQIISPNRPRNADKERFLTSIE